MSFQATTRVRLGTPGGVDDHGQEVGHGAPDPDAKDYRASIIERSRLTTDENGEPKTVRYIVGRVDPSCPVTDGDVLFDREGNVYAVDEVTRTPRTIAGAAVVRLDLRTTSGE